MSESSPFINYSSVVNGNGEVVSSPFLSSPSNYQYADQNLYKLFVGQIPSTTTEEEFRQLFAPFGEIADSVILKDRLSGAHKGCGFVYFSNKQSADEAIKQLGDKVKLPNGHRELIVRYAGEKPEEREYKLYVCMLSKKTTDQELREMFEPFGPLTEVFIIRTREGNQSKGAAFIKFLKKEDAERAILVLHNKVKDKDAPGALQVRFAHTKAERNAQLSQLIASQQAAATQQLLLRELQNNLSNQSGASFSPFHPSFAQTLPFSALHMKQFPLSASANAGNFNELVNVNPSAGSSLSSAENGAFPNVSNVGLSFPTFSDSTSGQSPQFPFTHPGFTSGQLGQIPVRQAASPTGPGQDIRGPEGANIFVYNLPENYTELELSSLFSSFGTVLSSKVSRDLVTGVSKGFGFISFNDPNAARAAINSLDGFVVNRRRLSVRLKAPNHKQHKQAQGF